MPSPSDNLVIPRFYSDAVENKAKSREAGRPIFDDRELVEVRFAGNRQTVSVFPAHAVCGERQDEDGDTHKITYAERWPDQYRRYKAKQQQVAAGTPVDELPFLTMAKRSELKALSIYTAEALAALDGNELKNIGQGGRDLKNQAQAYLDNAAGTADVSGMAAKIADLQALVEELRSDRQPVQEMPVSQFSSWQPDQIKDWIEEQIGERPKGNPNLSTLIKRADEINAQLADVEAA